MTPERLREEFKAWEVAELKADYIASEYGDTDEYGFDFDLWTEADRAKLEEATA